MLQKLADRSDVLVSSEVLAAFLGEARPSLLSLLNALFVPTLTYRHLLLPPCGGLALVCPSEV